MPESSKHDRLRRDFHQTFKPERQYITAMLRYAASEREGDAQAIAADTGIPTGASSGKVPAILDYCRGMGLVRLGKAAAGAKKPELTSLGRVLLLEDPYLKTGISQWIAHFNLCNPISGADVWYRTFFEGLPSLGMSFEREKLDSHLRVVYAVKKTGLIGPMIGMYEDDASFRICGALSESSGQVARKPAPINDEFGYAYGAWLLQLMVEYFPKVSQVPVTELETKAGWRSIPGWNIGNHQRALQLVERKGLIEVDRHMQPWLIRPAAEAEATWKCIYDDLL